MDPKQPLFTQEELDELDSLPEPEFIKFTDTLTPEERLELDRIYSQPAPAPQAPSVGVPDMLNPATAGSQMAGFEAPPVAQPAPKPPVGEQIWSGLKEAVTPQVGDLWNPVASPLRQVEAVVQPLKQTYLDPVIKAGQKAYRETDVAQEALAKLDERVGAGPAQAIRNVSSLFLGSPETYRTEQEQAAGQKALAQSAVSTAQDVLGIAPEHRKQFAYPEQTALGAFANTATSELAYLPLYLIDAKPGSGLVKRAAIGGGLSEALDPREGANPVRGMQFAGALGGAFDALARVPAGVQKATDAVTWIQKLDLGGDLGLGDFKARAGVAVTPAEEVKKLVDAPVTGELKPGAKASLREARVGQRGGIEMRLVQVSDKGKKAGAWMPVGQKGAPVRGVVLATPEAAEAFKNLDPEGLSLGEVIVAKDMPAEALRLSDEVPPDEVRIRDASGKETVAFEDDAALPLHRLPDDDVLVSWNSGRTREFRPVKARTLQRESLMRRSLVEVTIAGKETHLGFLGAGSNDDFIVVAPEAAERIPGALTEDALVPKDWVHIVEPDGVNNVLDERAAMLAEEARVAADKATSEASIQVAAKAVGVQPPPPSPKLPKELAGAKPRYGFGSKQFTLQFDSDLDKALFIVSQSKKSKADGKYVAWLASQGIDITRAVALAQDLKTQIKGLAMVGEGGDLRVPAFADIAGVAQRDVEGWALTYGVLVPTQGGPRIPLAPTDGAPPPQAPPVNATPAEMAATPPPGGIPPPLPPKPGPSGGDGPAEVMKALERSPAAATLFVPATARGPRGELTPEMAVAAAHIASLEKSAEVAKSFAGRYIDIFRQNKAKWFKAMPQPRVKEFERELLDVISHPNPDMTDLLKKYPEVNAELEKFVNEWTDWSLRAEQRLTSGKNPFVESTPLQAPEGMKDFMKQLQDSKPYLAQLYLAQAAGEGALAKFYKTHRAEYDRIVKMAMDELKVTFPGEDPAELLRRARHEVSKYAGDPDVLAKRVKQEGPAAYSGQAAKREKRAADLDIYAQTFNEWSKKQDKGLVDVANFFLRGEIDNKQMAQLLDKRGLTLPPKDIKFLESFRDELKEALLPWQRAALKPVMDPFAAMAMSVARQQQNLLLMEAMNVARESGFIRTGGELVSAGRTNFEAEGWKQLPEVPGLYGRYGERKVTTFQRNPDGTLGPWEQETFFVHPDVYDSIVGYHENLSWLKNSVMQIQDLALSKPYTAWRLGKTVLNPKTWGIQVTGNIFAITYRAGISPMKLFRSGNYGRAVQQWKAFKESPFKLGKAGEMSEADWIREGMKRGTIGSDAMAAEVRPLFDALLKQEFALKEGGGVLTAFDKMVRGGRKLTEMYSAMDSVAKHGTWLTMLEDAGMDLKTGKVKNLEAADKFLNGGRLRQKVQGQYIDVKSLSPAELSEELKRVAGFRINRSFAMPDRPALVGEAAGQIATGTLGMGASPFSRVGVEEARANAMLPYRMVTEPGVGGAAFQWTLILGAMAGATGLAKKSMGMDDAEVDESWHGLNPTFRAFKPAPLALPFRGQNGEVLFLNLDRIFEMLRYANGSPTGATAAEELAGGPQLPPTPGQLASRALFNATAGSVGGTLTEPMLAWAAQKLGLNQAQRPKYAEAFPGPMSGVMSALEYMAPGAALDVARIATQTNRPENQGGPVPLGQALTPLLSLGTLQFGEKPGMATRQRGKEVRQAMDPDQQKSLEYILRTSQDPKQREEARAKLRELASQGRKP